MAFTSSSNMEKIDQILQSLYDKVIEPVEAKEQLSLLSVVVRGEKFNCSKCSSDWGEVRATCYNCGHESEDLST